MILLGLDFKVRYSGQTKSRTEVFLLLIMNIFLCTGVPCIRRFFSSWPMGPPAISGSMWTLRIILSALSECLSPTLGGFLTHMSWSQLR